MRIVRLASIVVLFLAGAGLVIAAWLLADLPAISDLDANPLPPSIRITDRHGRLLYEVIGQDSGRYAAIDWEEIPLYLRQATIATEDQTFYENPGLDVVGILRAAWINLRGGETIAGGSTITQQVARNFLLSADERQARTLRRKLRETILAWQLTRALSKDEILRYYLNHTYYGGLSYGVEAAAHTYFGKPASELDLAECALLAGLPQAPAIYNPYTYPDKAKERQGVVLQLMEARGFTTPQERRLAEQEPLSYAEDPYPIEAPHFVMMVRSELDRLLEMDTHIAEESQDALAVRTTLDLDWQHHAEAIIQSQLTRLREAEEGLGHNVNNAALVALDTHSGDVLALVGSPDYFDAQNQGAINMALAPRQPGSAIKPVLYAAALDPGQASPWTAATMLLDVTTTFTTQDGKVYTPENYDGQEHGPVSLRDALASSLNIPAVLTLEHIGLERFVALATRLGIETLADPHDYDLSIALGGGAVSLLDLTRAYAAFANGGFRLEPRLILEVSNLHGETLYQPTEQALERVLDERVAWVISDVLSDDQARMLGFGRNSVLRLDRPAAVKTGTTTNFHDNWTIGYTPDLVVGVWAGNSDYRPMRDVSGVSGAAPIWHQFMRTALAGQPETWVTHPPGINVLQVCTPSGGLPSPDCPYLRQEWFIAGSEPTEPDRLYHQVVIDTLNGRLASADTPPERRQVRLALDLPAQARAWAQKNGQLLLNDLLQGSADSQDSTASETGIAILTPTNGAIYRHSKEYASQSQQIHITTAAAGNLTQVTFWVDGQVWQVDNVPPFDAWWPLQPGSHRIWVTASRPDGAQVTSPVVQITVEAGLP
ncbi:MAG: penicillin-binding protein 1C [Anaerolineales bacterium]|nr:penicillin-binding protein 1C [Anaerolineales bacterium]